MSLRNLVLVSLSLACQASPLVPRQTSSAVPQPTAYALADDYSSAASFFGGFTFFDQADPTNGHVQFVNQAAAFAQGIAGVNPGGNGSVYLGVDHTSQAPSGRASTRVSSNKTYNHGLFVLDLLHMPGGICGVWPAFWTLGTGEWPNNGEIDILEGVNVANTNQMTLHTNAGCAMVAQNSSQYSGQKYSGTIDTLDCNVGDPNQAKNAGCGITDNRAATFGSQFNTQGGGVIAMEWTSNAINIWNFARSQLPADIDSAAPNPANWGEPASSFDSQSCDLDSHVVDQQIVFDTTFCGDWAGQVWSSTPQCAALAPTCEQYVGDNPSAFTDAYWEIQSLKVYQ